MKQSRSYSKHESTIKRNRRRSFLGMVNYCNKYIKDYPTITASLRLLTKKKQRFRLGTAQQDAFETLQERLTSAEAMLFIILTQMLSLLWMVVLLVLVLYLPRSNQMVTSDQLHMTPMHSVQQRYSQTERETLPFLWSCQHFHHYVYDCHVTIITDHKHCYIFFRQSHSHRQEFNDGCFACNEMILKSSTFQVMSGIRLISMIVSDAVPNACTPRDAHSKDLV